MSNFLENLKKSLEEGKVDESVKKQFSEIVEKAEDFNGKFDNLEKVDAKVAEAMSQRKALTEEERKEMEFQAIKQQQKIDEFDFNMNLGATLVNIDLVIEKLNRKIEEFKFQSAKLRDTSIQVSEKKQLLKDVLKEINKLEAPIAKNEVFSVTDDDFLISKNNNNAINESYF